MPKRKPSRTAQSDDHDIPLTKAQKKELDRRLADMLDPMRYVIVSPFSRTFSLFYQPGDGTYIMNEIPESTWFKRKVEALAVANSIEDRRRKKRLRRSLQVIAIRRTKDGAEVLEKVISPWNSRQRWKPVLKQPGKMRPPRRRKDKRPH